MVITDGKCETPLQDLMNHTVSRLCEFLDLTFNENTHPRLVLICKYGFDGTNGPTYKQKTQDKDASYGSIFGCSLVPLSLIDEEMGEE